MANRDCTIKDPTLKEEIAATFGLKAFAKATGITYDAVTRTVNQSTCTEFEMKSVLDNWLRLDPQTVAEWVEPLCKKNEDLQKLYLITLDLYAALKKDT